MTLNELADTLPNGLHDAEVSRLLLDYSKQEARFVLDVWVGDLASKEHAVREEYRRATLLLSGLVFCAIEPPSGSGKYPYDDAAPLTVDTGSLPDLASPPSVVLPEDAPPEAFTNWFFVSEWNAFIYVSARDASLTWEP